MYRVTISKIAFMVYMIISLALVPSCKKMEKYKILETPFSVIDKFGNNRDYRIYLPEREANLEVPLLVYFHGVRSECFKKYAGLKNYTGSPVEETGLIEFCKLNKIALLAPEPRYEYKFLNCRCKGWSPFNKEIDGIEKIIDVVVDKYKISEKEIYLAGLSAGAVLCHHLANRRPDYFNAILSHSQAYIKEDVTFLEPKVKGPKFGVIICYTKGDYTNLINICLESEKLYRKHNYKTILIRDLPPNSHRWSKESNQQFWNYLKKCGQYTSLK